MAIRATLSVEEGQALAKLDKQLPKVSNSISSPRKAEIFALLIPMDEGILYTMLENEFTSYAAAFWKELSREQEHSVRSNRLSILSFVLAKTKSRLESEKVMNKILAKLSGEISEKDREMYADAVALLLRLFVRFVLDLGPDVTNSPWFIRYMDECSLSLDVAVHAPKSTPLLQVPGSASSLLSVSCTLLINVREIEHKIALANEENPDKLLETLRALESEKAFSEFLLANTSYTLVTRQVVPESGKESGKESDSEREATIIVADTKDHRTSYWFSLPVLLKRLKEACSDVSTFIMKEVIRQTTSQIRGNS